MALELDRARVIDNNFSKSVLSGHLPSAKSLRQPQDVGLTREYFLDLFHSQLVSRHCDLQARILRQKNEGFYTIGSSGHEGNAAVAKAFGVNDLAFVHYRSGAFMVQRAKQVEGQDSIYVHMLSLVAAKTCPISGGRHKIFGSKVLNVPPQTSTVASHLPKAVGAALSIHFKPSILPKESVVLCSFGDAAVNHSTAQGAFNTAIWLAYHNVPLPIVFICEDNGFGISVPTPSGWVQHAMASRKGMDYLKADGLNLADTFGMALDAENIAREKRKPVFLHLKMVRLMGHAGSDIEFHYRTQKDIVATEKDDPLLHSARQILEKGWLTKKDIITQYEKVRKEVQQKAALAIKTPKLMTAKEIMAPLVPPSRNIALPDLSMALKTSKTQKTQKSPCNMAQCLNAALCDILLQYPNTVVFGEDVGCKGGVYRITADLLKQFGPNRVFDTLLDEQTILGTAIGMAHNGILPIPEIQFLAYTHNAIDQIRGEAATLSFFSNSQYTNPMVIRVPSFGYQKGFGGHFHNDNAIGFLREIPGLLMACPATPREAALLLRECVKQAYLNQRVVCFLEPIALYRVKDLQKIEDNQFLESYPDLTQDCEINFGEVGVEAFGEDVAIISYGNGHYLSRQAAYTLKEKFDAQVTLVDLRWLAPLPEKSLLKAVKGFEKILIVDEGRKTGGLSEQLMALFLEKSKPLPKLKRITGQDSFIPLGDAWQNVLPKKEDIIEAVLNLLDSKNQAKIDTKQSSIGSIKGA